VRVIDRKSTVGEFVEDVCEAHAPDYLIGDPHVGQGC